MPENGKSYKVEFLQKEDYIICHMLEAFSVLNINMHCVQGILRIKEKHDLFMSLSFFFFATPSSNVFLIMHL